MVTLKSRAEIERMRRAGRIVGEVLDKIEAELRPGVSTAHLDAIAEAHIRASGATPSFKGYPGINPRRPFPASVCISIDDEIVHGIPGERTIRAGQIVSVDAGAIVDGWHGDGARTLYVGDPPAEIAQLIDLTREAMLAGIAAAIPGNHIEDISAAVEAVAARAGLGVIRQFVGHGIGTEMHEDPQIPNYRTGRPGRKLEAGLVQVPEGRRIFPNLSVRENLELGSYRRGRSRAAEEPRPRRRRSFPRLKERWTQAAGTLSGGEQQMLAIGRGLMSEPKLLILDEPSLGLSPLLVEEMFALIGRLNAEGLAILLVEQNVVQSLAIAHRAYVLEGGVVALSGKRARARRAPRPAQELSRPLDPSCLKLSPRP